MLKHFLIGYDNEKKLKSSQEKNSRSLLGKKFKRPLWSKKKKKLERPFRRKEPNARKKIISNLFSPVPTNRSTWVTPRENSLVTKQWFSSKLPVTIWWRKCLLLFLDFHFERQCKLTLKWCHHCLKWGHHCL